MKASVIIPVYNTGVLLRRMLDSVLAQTERDLELICVDDSSTDGSDLVIEEYARRDGRVRLIRQKNQGPYVARSTGILAARGEYVYICDHDDRLHPQLLEFCIHELETNNAGIIVFGHDNRMEQGGFEMPPLPDFSSIDVKVLDDSVLRSDPDLYRFAVSQVHIDQWAHVARRELAQSVLCQSDYNLPRTLDLIKRTDRWCWTPLALYYYNVGNPGSLIKKAPTRKNILDTHKDLIGLLDLFREERESGDRFGVWDTVCRVFLVPNVKMMYNMIRRGRKVLVAEGRLEESYRLFAVLLYDIFSLRGIPLGFAKLRHRLAYRWLLFRFRPDLEQSREALTARVLHNRSIFEGMSAKLDGLDGDEETICGVKESLAFLMNHATGYFSSDAIERALQKVANHHHVELSASFSPGSVLHVMTDYLAVGGHTRVVERWIARSPQKERHCVAVLAPAGRPLPKALKEGVAARRGEVVFFEPGTDVEKALRLRRLASAFERVVLHVFPDDIVPILAFGVEDFKRPVFLFNHADHVFGLGVSIADAFIDFRSGGIELSKRYRGTKNSHFLDLPCGADGVGGDAADLNVSDARETLGLPPGRKIIVSAASAYKYKPFLEWNFVDYMEKVFDRCDDADFVIIGPKSLRGTFRFRGRVHMTGLVPPQTLLRYFRCADLVVDSFPFGSGLSLQDAISVGAPVLSIETIAGKMDYVQESSAYVHSVEELADATCKVLTDRKYAESIRDDVTARLARVRSPETWLAELSALNGLVVRHGIHPFASVARSPVAPVDLFVESQRVNLKIKFDLFGWVRIVSYRDCGRKRHTVLFPHGGAYRGWLQ